VNTFRLSSAEVDDEAAVIVELVLAHQLDEQTARDRLADLAFTSRVIHQTVAQRVHRNDFTEVLSQVVERITVKIVDPDAGGFDFARSRGTSFCAFVRNLASQVVKTSARDLARHRERQTPIYMGGAGDVGQHGDGDDSEFQASLHPATDNYQDPGRRIMFATTPSQGADTDLYQAATTPLNERVEQLLDGASHILRQPDTRPFYSASIVLRVSNIPTTANRPLLYTKRRQAWKLLTSPTGGELAMKSLQAALHSTDNLDGVELLIDLWADWGADDMAVLLNRGVLHVHAVALGAVSPYPLPGERDRARFAHQLRSLSTSPEYRELVPGLVRSFLAAECVHTSLYSGGGRSVFTLTDADANMLHSRVVEVTHLPGAPLGTKPSDVLAVLGTHLRMVLPDMSFEGLEASAREALQRRAH